MNTSMSTCASCAWWLPYLQRYPKSTTTNPVERAGGLCTSPRLTEDYGTYAPDMLVYPYQEDGYFWTGPLFGCVHHQPHPTAPTT